MSTCHAAPLVATGSEQVPPPAKRTKSQKRQLHQAPALLRPALFEAFDRALSITTIDASGRVAVVVHQPTLATVASLLGVLNILQLAVVLAMVARAVNGVRVFAAPRVVVGPALARVAAPDVAGALVYSGAYWCPAVVRVGRGPVTA